MEISVISTLFSQPGMGLGLARTGQNALPVPLTELSSPLPQSVAPSDMSFDEWTFHIKFADIGTPAATEYLWNLQFDSNDFIYLRYLNNGNIQLSIKSNGVVQGGSYVIEDADYLLGQGDASITVSGKMDSLVVAVNGIIMYIIDDVDMPLNVPVGLGIGQTNGGANKLTASIKEFRYYNKRLPNYVVKQLGRHQDFGVTFTHDPDRLIHFKLGQSNSVGSEAVAPLPGTYTNLARMQLVTKDGALDTSYQDPSSHNGAGALFSNFSQNGTFSSGGAEIDDIAGANSGKDLAVMHIDRGNTGLINAAGNFVWKPWSVSGGVAKLNAPAYQATLMQMIGMLHGTPFSRTWWQGEKDAGDVTITQSQYRNELVNLLSVFDEYVRVPTIVVGLHDEPGTLPARWAAVQAAQAEINTYHGSAWHVSAKGASTVLDEVHLDQAGYISVGADIATQINAVT